MVARNRNSWRSNLDPRDPDYIDPPTDEEIAESIDTKIFYAENETLEFFADNME